MAEIPASPPTDPRRNPSYPQRAHIRERAQWQAILQHWDGRLAAARQAPRANDPAASRLLVQMAGAIDQIADAVRRLPMEVGDLYSEDRHRVEEATNALERLFARWDGSAGRG